MTIHLCRDYVTQSIGTTNRTYVYGYILSIFLRRVLKYSFVGSTNYNINSIGSLLIATGDTNPTGTSNFPNGAKAGINLGSQREFYVSIPSSIRTVSASDIGRILSLRSVTNPRFNSGIFLVVGFELSSNSYIIDYRTLGQTPPVEVPDSIEWYLYEKDTSCPLQGSENTKSSTSYRGDGNSTTPRIILQSPHALGWQVRICNETPADIANTIVSGVGNCPTTTVSPGFGGDSAGDFPAQGQHFHAPMWYNTSDLVYTGCAPGLGDGGGNIGIQTRITIVGDDTGQGVTFYGRIPQNTRPQPASNILTFGLSENEPAPLPIYDQARLFVLGTGYIGPNYAGVNDGSLLVNSTAQFNSNTYYSSVGMSASTVGTPTSCSASFWAYVTGTNQGFGPTFDSSASDNPFTSSTELLPIDLIQGTVGSWGAQTSNVLLYAPRNMGSIPHLKSGRANFGDFSLTTDSEKKYQHLRRGLYIPWQGPNLIP